MRWLSSSRFQEFVRRRARLSRRLRRQAPVVHYFHQVDDPYSHLAVQKLDELNDAYALPFVPHLVSSPDAAFLGDADHFDEWAMRDAVDIAPAFATTFPDNPRRQNRAAVMAANNLLADYLELEDFASTAKAVGTELWTGQLARHTAAPSCGERAIRDGNLLRQRLGHYFGAMFYFDGEWYWGVDRLRSLEARLVEEGFGATTGEIRVPEPAVTSSSGLDAGHIQLEYFPSLRSPYTAIGHRRVLDLIDRTGVSVKLCPVMPMLMRGVPAPPAKQRYIITDAGREGRARGTPFGKIVDPFGDPVTDAFALFPAAAQLGKGMDFVTAYLAAAWVEGIDITTRNGLRQVAANADIEWSELMDARNRSDWEALLDENLAGMLGAGLWGVPSFRVTGGADETPFACWGQDRIWRVENEIARRTTTNNQGASDPCK